MRLYLPANRLFLQYSTQRMMTSTIKHKLSPTTSSHVKEIELVVSSVTIKLVAASDAKKKSKVIPTYQFRFHIC